MSQKRDITNYRTLLELTENLVFSQPLQHISLGIGQVVSAQWRESPNSSFESVVVRFNKFTDDVAEALSVTFPAGTFKKRVDQWYDAKYLQKFQKSVAKTKNEIKILEKISSDHVNPILEYRIAAIPRMDLSKLEEPFVWPQDNDMDIVTATVVYKFGAYGSLDTAVRYIRDMVDLLKKDTFRPTRTGDTFALLVDATNLHMKYLTIAERIGILLDVAEAISDLHTPSPALDGNICVHQAIDAKNITLVKTTRGIRGKLDNFSLAKIVDDNDLGRVRAYDKARFGHLIRQIFCRNIVNIPTGPMTSFIIMSQSMCDLLIPALELKMTSYSRNLVFGMLCTIANVCAQEPSNIDFGAIHVTLTNALRIAIHGAQDDEFMQSLDNQFSSPWGESSSNDPMDDSSDESHPTFREPPYLKK